MAYIITEPCIGTCDTACVDVCPVDCIHGPLDLEKIRGMSETERKTQSTQLFIHPEDCINCGACEPECPVEAIFDEDDVPSEWESYIESNKKFFEDLENS